MLELIVLVLMMLVIGTLVILTFCAHYKMIQSWENEAREIEKRLRGEQDA